MTHPYRLHALAALHALRRAAAYLADARTAVLISRPQLGPADTRPRSLAALRAHDRLLRAERADRLQQHRTGRLPTGDMPAPTDPGLLDLDTAIAAGLAEAVLLTASALRRRPGLNYAAARDYVGSLGVFSGRCVYLIAALPHVPPHLACDLGRDLGRLDQRTRALLGLDADLWPLPGAPACPACGRRTLAAQTSAADSTAWTVTCDSPACICAGRLCRCGMTSRPRGIRHIWPADMPVLQTVLTDLSPPATTTA